MTPRRSTQSRIRADHLLSLMGSTPADNHEGHDTAVPLASTLAGNAVKGLFQWQRLLDSTGQNFFLGPLAMAATWQSQLLRFWITDPVRLWAKISVSTGRNPDIFAEQDERIETSYAGLLSSFCGFFIEEGRFDREKALRVTTEPEGIAWLQGMVREFAWLERAYCSRGLTGLMAFKELLKGLLVLITEAPLENGSMPFWPREKTGKGAVDFSAYLDGLQVRLENLYAENGFDYKRYAEIATQEKLGYSFYETVEGSKMHSASLRHYPLPPSIPANGIVIYMATPLINRPELFDLARGKSVIEGMQRRGYTVYLVDHGQPGPEDTQLGLDFYGKTLHDRYLDLIHRRHPGATIYAMCYCMGGTLFLPYLCRRAQEKSAMGKEMDIRKVALMAAPYYFEDNPDGMGPMRTVIRKNYDADLMSELFGDVNIPPQIIETGMHEIQPGVRYSVAMGFFDRAVTREGLRDSAPFLFWLTHGTRFPARAHREWIRKVYMENQIARGLYCLPSRVPELDGRPVDMNVLTEAGIAYFDYRGMRDPITPMGSGLYGHLGENPPGGSMKATRTGLNRAIEKNIGHIFVVSQKLLAEYLEMVMDFFEE